MKTFVSDDYQIALWDDGSFEVRIKGFFCEDTCITYSPAFRNKKYTWSKRISTDGSVETFKTSENIGGLWLSTSNLRTLHKALEAIGRQDLMDNEIVFVDKGEEDGWK